MPFTEFFKNKVLKIFFCLYKKGYIIYLLLQKICDTSKAIRKTTLQ